MADPFEALRQIEELRYSMEYFGKYNINELAGKIADNFRISRNKTLDMLEGIIERTLEMRNAAWKLHDLIKGNEDAK